MIIRVSTVGGLTPRKEPGKAEIYVGILTDCIHIWC